MTSRMMAVFLSVLVVVFGLALLFVALDPPKPRDPCALLAAWKPMYSGDGRVAGLVCYAVNPPRVAAFR